MKSKTVLVTLLLIAVLAISSTSYAENMVMRPNLHSFGLQNVEIQKGPSILKLNANVSQAKMPVKDGLFNAVTVRIYNDTDGANRLCEESFSDVPVVNSILNLNIGEGMNCNGSQFEDIVAENNNLYIGLELVTSNGDTHALKPYLQFGTVPYAIKSNYSVHANDAVACEVSAQSAYTHRSATSDDLYSGTVDPYSYGYFDYATPDNPSILPGGFIQWHPKNGSEEENSLTICRDSREYDALGNVIDYNGSTRLDHFTVDSEKTVIKGSLEVTGDLIANVRVKSGDPIDANDVATKRYVDGLDKTHKKLYTNIITVKGDVDTFYPVVFKLARRGLFNIDIYRDYRDTAPSDWNSSTHKGGLTFSMDVAGTEWGGNPSVLDVKKYEYTYTPQVAKVAYTAHGYSAVVWLRGGGTGGAKYYIEGTLPDITAPDVFYAKTLTYNHSQDKHDTYVEPETEIALRSVDNNTIFAGGGRVGIGTKEPAARLDVHGGMIVSGKSSLKGGVETSSINVTNSADIGYSANIGDVEFKADERGILHVGKAARIGINDKKYLYINEEMISTGQNHKIPLRLNPSGGKIGIGTRSADKVYEYLTIHSVAKEQVATKYSNDATGDSSGSGFVVGIESGGNGLVWNREPQYIRFGTDAKERMRIGKNGKVGIGTSAPQHGMLEIRGEGSGGGVTLYRGSGKTTARMYLDSSDEFHINRGGSTSKGITMETNGEVGVGTTNPTEKLHVNGNLRVTGTVKIDKMSFSKSVSSGQSDWDDNEDKISLGSKSFCALSYHSGSGSCNVYKSGSTWYLRSYRSASCKAVCF